MQNMIMNTCEKFHYDRLRNDRALGNGKSDNNKKKGTVGVTVVFLPVAGGGATGVIVSQ